MKTKLIILGLLISCAGFGQVFSLDQPDSVKYIYTNVFNLDNPLYFQASVNAGANDTITAGQTYTLAGTKAYTDSTVWATSGTGTFDNDNSLAAVYTPSEADIAAGTVTLTLTGYVGGASTGNNTVLKIWDADAGAYIDSTNLINGRQKTAADYIVRQLKANSLWTGTVGFYPFYGDSASAVRNLKNPANTDAAFRLDDVGTWTYSGTTATPTGNAYFDTHINPYSNLTLNNTAVGYYTTNINNINSIELGAKDATNYLWLRINNGGVNQGIMYSASYPSNQNIQAKGFNLISRTGATSLKTYNNQTLYKSLAGGGGGTAEPNVNLYINAWNNNGTPANYSSRPVKYVYVGAGLSDANAAILSKIIERARTIAENRDTIVTVTLDNTNNPHDLTDYIAEIKLTENDIDLSGVYDDGSNLRFLYNGVELPRYVDYVEKYNNRLTAYVKVGIPANTSKVIEATWGIETADSSKTFAQIMTRKQPIDSTWAFYKLDDLSDSLSVGADFIGTNTTFVVSKGINALNCNGTNAYATLAEDVPLFGWLSFNFILTNNFQGTGAPTTIFSKYYDAENFYELRTTTNGVLQYNGKTNNTSITYSFPEVFIPKDKVNSVTIRFDEYYTIIKFNEHEYGFRRPDTSSSGQPICLGALYTGSASQYVAASFFDFEIGKGYYSSAEEINRHKLLPLNYQAKEYEKWELITEVPNTLPDDSLRQEPNLISVNDTLFLYNTGEDGIERRYSVNDGVTWSNYELLTGLHASPERPFVLYDSSTYYIILTDNESNGLVIYESQNGISFTNKQNFIADTYGTNENSFVFYDESDNLYKGVVDVSVSAGYWKPYFIEGETLYDMEYKSISAPTSIKYTDINKVSPVVYDAVGGGFMAKVNGEYYLWLHSNPPSVVWTFKSDNYYNDTWERVNQFETFTLDSRWAGDQKADFSMCEHNGKTIAAINNSQNIDGVTGNTSIYVYDGSLSELVNNLIITIE